MTIAFGTEKLKLQLTNDDVRLKTFGIRAKKVSQRLDEIEDARSLAMLLRLSYLQCRQLTHNPAGEWVLKVLPNYSLIFLLDHEQVPMRGDGTVEAEQITNIRITGFYAY